MMSLFKKKKQRSCAQIFQKKKRLAAQTSKPQLNTKGKDGDIEYENIGKKMEMGTLKNCLKEGNYNKKQ